MTQRNKVAITIAIIGTATMLLGGHTEGALIWVIAGMYAE